MATKKKKRNVKGSGRITCSVFYLWTRKLGTEVNNSHAEIYQVTMFSSVFLYIAVRTVRLLGMSAKTEVASLTR